MRRVEDLPYEIEEEETLWIPLPDGTRLAARAWVPRIAAQEPVPAVIEYIPYRRHDHTRWRDSQMMPYLAGHGYACLRIDMRGSGDSEGILEDEYLPQELEDACAAIRWIAEQRWCDGSVGMIGISWGGFNGLQVAALRPPPLKAVVSLCSTDDRYADDVHYMGGCLLGDNLSWASVMFAFNSCPPDPEVVGERWRDMWFERLDHCRPWLETWMRHQTRDEYWKHGSICEDYGDIEIPLLLASGWADGYSNAIFRMLDGLKAPCKALIGPWSHIYPHIATPGPAIGFLQEVVRWWDHHLKGIDRGVDEDPMLRVWMQDSVPAHPSYEFRPGRWVAEQQWPAEHVKAHRFFLDGPSHHLVEDPREPLEEDALWVQSPLNLGMFAGKWCSYAAPPDLPHDQRSEDGGALIFETEPLAEEVEILGGPVARLELSVNRPVAMVAVRISDVAPDGEATRVTYGILNLTHRDGHEHPEPLEPGRHYDIGVKLNDIAQNIPAGHRIRLAISTSYFPLAWPPPEPVTLTVYTGRSHLELPLRPPRESDAQLREFGPPESTPPEPIELRSAPDNHWRVVNDLGEDFVALEVLKDGGTRYIPKIDLEIGARTRESYSFRRKDYDSLRGEVDAERTFRRGEWNVRTVTRTVLTSDATHFRIHASLDAYEGERRVRSDNWDFEIPRHLV